MRYFAFVVLLSPIFALANSKYPEYKSDFIRQYSIFTEAVYSDDFKAISEYESKDTKCGFGVNEYGKGCIQNAISEYSNCKSDMLLALKMGCKIEENTDSLSCTAPFNWGDKSIIHAGARSQFYYQIETKTMTVNYFICGGD